MTVRTLESLDDDALWLESMLCADRWQTGTDAHGDSQSAWFCRDCGAEVSDPDEGCEHCGYGTAIAHDITPSSFDNDAEEDHRTC